MSDTIQDMHILYRYFFLYIEPLSALVGAWYAFFLPAHYLALLSAAPYNPSIALTPGPPAPTTIALFQLANLYLFFALVEHLVLGATSSRRVWRRLLFCMLLADFGHLATMRPLAREKADLGRAGLAEVYLHFWKWSAMEWGSVGFVYAGALMRTSFLLGIGVGTKSRVQ
ncbi:hypothetical protein OBBRIDRAFT_121089 [Obba rivulosa]|uniref:DUF7704 domain-containing protein n=1 Tax=Obba rivulosa TaxID=1052685 RepID=A0A8E2J4J3_9APHY|nr:hypothetical protein OBBRIDRAFT_121089 [Obba rivulosa]